MHEMGIAMEIIQIVKDSIPEDMTECTVRSVNVDIGQMSSVVPESLTFCFEMASKETVCEGAELIITEIPSIMTCESCAHEWHVDAQAFTCPECDSIKIQLSQHTDIDINSFDIE